MQRYKQYLHQVPDITNPTHLCLALKPHISVIPTDVNVQISGTTVLVRHSA
nr:uncharacterized protein CI109_007020 [Kwoniella shandongensis]KAA5524634.1 hypothetical protein CI109_007020 [Kwoniella shandongensis]